MLDIISRILCKVPNIKPFEGFKHLTYFEKSQLVTTWVQTLIITGGFMLAVNQFSVSEQSINDSKIKESLKYIESHQLAQRKNKESLVNDLERYSKGNLSKSNYDRNKFDKLLTSYFESVDKMIRCSESEVCNSVYISAFTCFEIKQFLSATKMASPINDDRIDITRIKTMAELRINDVCSVTDRLIYWTTGAL